MTNQGNVAELLALARGGVYLAPSVTGTGGALLPHHFNLTCDRSHVGGIFSVALSLTRSRGRWELPTTVSCRVRTFLALRRDRLSTPQFYTTRVQMSRMHVMNTLLNPETAVRIGAWLAPELADDICTALSKAGIILHLAAGEGPHIMKLKDDHGIEVCSDPRKLFAEDVSCVLMADPDLALDTEAIATMGREASRTGVRFCTLIPRPVEFTELLQLHDSGPLPRVVPLLSDTVRGRSFLDDAAAFGPIDSVHISFDTRRPFGSSSSRLYDAFDVLQSLMGTPIAVDAASSARHGVLEHKSIKQVMAIARFDDGRVASVNAGGNCGNWSRSITVWGEQGRMSWNNGIVEYSDGQTDSQKNRIIPSNDHMVFTDELSESIHTCVTGDSAPDDHERQLLVLSTVEACRLAMKTGEPESVQGVRDILRRL